MKLTKTALLFLPFLLMGSHLSAQSHMSVSKPGTKKRIVFWKGDFIHLKTADSTYSGKLVFLSDSLLIIEERVVIVDSITLIYDYSHRHFLQQGSVKFKAAGIFYGLFTTGNRIGNGDKPIFTEHNGFIVAGLVAAGYLCQVFRRGKFKINKKARLYVISPLIVPTS